MTGSLPGYGIGIDFGTTKSHIAIVNLDTNVFQLEGQRDNTISTILHMMREKREWRYTVGAAALRQPSVGLLEKDIKEGVRTQKVYEYQPDGTKIPAVVLVASVLERLYRIVPSDYRENIKRDEKITITIPADLGMNARASMVFASRLLGFENVNLLEEPLAAFLHFYHRLGANVERFLGRNILVIDFGGGTCDISSIRIGESGKPPTVLKKASNDKLGGDQVTESILDKILTRDNYGLPEGSEYRLDALQTVSEAKHQIVDRCWRNGVMDLLPLRSEPRRNELIARFGNVPVQVNQVHKIGKTTGKATFNVFNLSGEEFYKITETVIQEKLNQLLVQFSPAEHDRILLVGGSSRLPQVIFQVYDWLSETTSDADARILVVNEPDSYIAKGAALYQYYQHKHRNIPVSPLLDRDLSLLIKPRAYSSGLELQDLFQNQILERLVQRGVHLPFPNKSTSTVDLPDRYKDRLVDENRLLRCTYKVTRDHENRATLVFFDGNTPLSPRMIDLPVEINESNIVIDFRINEQGLLELIARIANSRVEPVGEPLLIDYDFNPSNWAQIKKYRDLFNLD